MLSSLSTLAGAGSASIQADLATILESDEEGATATRRLVELLTADGRGVAVATVSTDEPIEIDVDASTGEAGEEAVAPAG